MTTKNHLLIFILSFFIFSLVLPKTGNMLPAKNVTPIEITLDDNTNRQDIQKITPKDNKKTDIWAIVTAFITAISIIFIFLNPTVWFLLSPLALITAIYSLIRIKRHNNLKGKFWNFIAIINFIFSILLVIFVIILISSINLQCNYN